MIDGPEESKRTATYETNQLEEKKRESLELATVRFISLLSFLFLFFLVYAVLLGLGRSGRGAVIRRLSRAEGIYGK